MNFNFIFVIISYFYLFLRERDHSSLVYHRDQLRGHSNLIYRTDLRDPWLPLRIKSVSHLSVGGVCD